MSPVAEKFHRPTFAALCQYRGRGLDRERIMTQRAMDAIMAALTPHMEPGRAYSAFDLAALVEAPTGPLSMALRRAALQGHIQMDTALRLGAFKTTFTRLEQAERAAAAIRASGAQGESNAT